MIPMILCLKHLGKIGRPICLPYRQWTIVVQKNNLKNCGTLYYQVFGMSPSHHFPCIPVRTSLCHDWVSYHYYFPALIPGSLHTSSKGTILHMLFHQKLIGYILSIESFKEDIATETHVHIYIYIYHYSCTGMTCTNCIPTFWPEIQ